MNNIIKKINKEALDSEIIQYIECAKKDPKFDINGCVTNWSVLMIAIVQDRKELVEYLLLDPCINVNHKCSFGSTALYYCDKVSNLKLLLSHGTLMLIYKITWERRGYIVYVIGDIKHV